MTVIPQKDKTTMCPKIKTKNKNTANHCGVDFNMVHLKGVEPPTCGLGNRLNGVGAYLHRFKGVEIA